MAYNKMSAAKKRTNKSSKNASLGQAFERYVSMSNRRYRDIGEADMYKQHPEVKVRRGDDGFNGARFGARSGLDYIGVYKGRAVTFDAKETKGASLPLNNIKAHQIETLQRFKAHGGISFLLVHMSRYGEVYVISTDDVIAVKESDRKSIPYSLMTERGYLVKPGNNVTVDYLTTMERAIDDGYL